MNRLKALDKHFIINMCKLKSCTNRKDTCLKEATEFAKAVLVLQSTPEIIDPAWRKKNPFLRINYMNKFPMSFDTEKLMEDIDVAARPNCQCSPYLCERSNDGINRDI
jgi:hypothetical protein